MQWISQDRSTQKNDLTSMIEIWNEGRISGEFLYLYPPGIPMIVPGEKIDGTLLKKLEGYKKKGFQFQGLRDYGGEKIEVVK